MVSNPSETFFRVIVLFKRNVQTIRGAQVAPRKEWMLQAVNIGCVKITSICFICHQNEKKAFFF